MLKFEVSHFKYIVDMDTGFPSDNTIISYKNGEGTLYLDETKTKGFYFVGVFSTPMSSRYTSLHRVRLDCLLLDDKVYTMKEEPVFYA